MATSTITITIPELKSIQKELEMLEIEIMRLKALLVSTAELSGKELRAAHKRMASGHWISLNDLLGSTLSIN